mmetsp:Transcript_47703/g.145085  ORF Transcript_47703/g.145085 Transcript_47703/m.145085 type:complete len:268 (+) Transcript_47703:289-1092(+)
MQCHICRRNGHGARCRRARCDLAGRDHRQRPFNNWACWRSRRMARADALRHCEGLAELGFISPLYAFNSVLGQHLTRPAQHDLPRLAVCELPAGLNVGQREWQILRQLKYELRQPSPQCAEDCDHLVVQGSLLHCHDRGPLFRLALHALSGAGLQKVEKTALRPRYALRNAWELECVVDGHLRAWLPGEANDELAQLQDPAPATRAVRAGYTSGKPCATREEQAQSSGTVAGVRAAAFVAQPRGAPHGRRVAVVDQQRRTGRVHPSV